MKILFIGYNRLGDAILSTSLLRIYNKNQNHITVICSPISEDIYSSFKFVRKIISVEKKKYSKHWIDAYKQIEKFNWDLVIDLRNTVLSRIIFKKKVFRFKVKNQDLHRVDNLYNLINEKKRPGPKIITTLKAKNSAKETINTLNLKGNILSIAPVTNWHRKNWPINNFAELIKKLFLSKKYNFSRVLLFGSEHEFKQCELLTKKLFHIPTSNLAGKIEILTIYEIMRKCKFFIGNDSGLTHLSAASGIKTLALFGPSKEKNYRPWGKNAHYIRTSETFEELTKGKNYNRFNKSSLMRSLSVVNVYKKCQKILD